MEYQYELKRESTSLVTENIENEKKQMYQKFFNKLNCTKQRIFVTSLKNNEIPKEIFDTLSKDDKMIIETSSIPLKESFSKSLTLLLKLLQIQENEEIEELLKIRPKD